MSRWFVSATFVICVGDFHRNFMISWFVTVWVRNFHDLCSQLFLWRSFGESRRNGVWALQVTANDAFFICGCLFPNRFTTYPCADGFWDLVSACGLVVTVMVWILLQVICKHPWGSCELTVCLDQLSLLPSAGGEMRISLWAMGWRPSVVDCGGGMFACCTVGPVCHWRR